MLVLGLNAYHGDSAACILRDGILLAAAEEERFRRIKHWAGFPSEAIKFCLKEAGASLRDLDHVAINRDPSRHHWRRLAFVLRNRPSPSLILSKLKNVRKAATIEQSIRAAFPNQAFRARIHRVDHHRAHLASAYLSSPFSQAVCVSVDGFGDFASAAWGRGHGNDIQIDGKIYFPHSLGIFYSALTQFLGFLNFGDEYKVMGLAPYGKPAFLPEMRQLVQVQSDSSYKLNLHYFRHHNQNVVYTWNDCSPDVGLLYTPALARLVGPPRQKNEPLEQRHKDLACSVQAMYEEALFALLNRLYEIYRLPNLALSGGCAMNSVANGKVYGRTPFQKIYLPPAAGDAGGAVGSALAVWHSCAPSIRPASLSLAVAERPSFSCAYLGPSFDSAYMKALLKARLPSCFPGNHRRLDVSPAGPLLNAVFLEDTAELCLRTAKAIAEGKVIGWFQGRMEWGPRALGNRSILGDPRRADMKDILNSKIKRRESFRPFAPSILRERVSDWFEQDDDVPFMMSVFRIRSDKQTLIPAVTHVDGSGRLQTVHRDTNPIYHQLITEFERQTGIPIVLNTSFNENEPIVCKPEEALDCFLRTEMDVLVLGQYFITRDNHPLTAV